VLLRKFESLLDEHVTETGITGLVKAAFGILAAGGILYTVLGSFAVKAAGLTIAALSTLGLLVLLLTSQRRLRRESELAQALLNHHCQLWYEQTEYRWRIDHWDESATIASNGDAQVSVTVKALVEAQALPFFRIRIGSGPNWTQPEWERRRAVVTVASVQVDGTGPQFDKTLRWLPDGRLEIRVHFRSLPPRKGEELNLLFAITWPGKARPLMRGEVDEFVFRAGRPLALLRYRLSLPPGSRVRHTLVGLDAGDDYEFSAPTDTDPTVELVAHDIEAHRRIGMRLDLK
jgi:hypothetical protein